MKLILLLIPFWLFAQINIINVGESKSFVFNTADIKVYSNVDLNIYKEYKNLNQEVGSFFIQSLFALSDSGNSPEAFDIKFDDGGIKCLRVKIETTEMAQENCAIKAGIESSSYEIQRKLFRLKCQEY